MGFIESYKHLEKICGEIMDDERRLSAYIDEMLKKPDGSFYVRGWDDDLKRLKHYRWIRNQISHEPGCTEQNMCQPGDSLWLDDFYERIMNQADPLARYYQATNPQITQQTCTKQNQSKIYNPSINNTYNKSYQNNRKVLHRPVGCISVVSGVLFIVVTIIFIF